MPPHASLLRCRRRKRFAGLPYMDIDPVAPGWVPNPVPGAPAQHQQLQQKAPAPNNGQRTLKVKLPAAVQAQLQQNMQQQQQQTQQQLQQQQQARGGLACNGPAQATPGSSTSLPSLVRKRKQPDGGQGTSQHQPTVAPALRGGAQRSTGSAPAAAPAPAHQLAAPGRGWALPAPKGGLGPLPQPAVAQPQQLGASVRGPALPAPKGGLFPLPQQPGAASGGNGGGRAEAPRWHANGGAMQPLKPGVHSLSWAPQTPHQPRQAQQQPPPPTPLDQPRHSGGSSGGSFQAAADAPPLRVSKTAPVLTLAYQKLMRDLQTACLMRSKPLSHIQLSSSMLRRFVAILWFPETFHTTQGSSRPAEAHGGAAAAQLLQWQQAQHLKLQAQQRAYAAQHEQYAAQQAYLLQQQQQQFGARYAPPHAAYPPTAEEIQQQQRSSPALRISMHKGVGPRPLPQSSAHGINGALSAGGALFNPLMLPVLGAQPGHPGVQPGMLQRAAGQQTPR